LSQYVNRIPVSMLHPATGFLVGLRHSSE
ncbi:uncharacterized protein METZ01_LOCUS176273, partial [marine metagenome]